MENTRTLLLILVVAAVTALTRFLPFLIFRGEKKTPEYILWLGKVLPCAIMGMLVVYCLKGMSFTSFPFGLPEIIACAAVVLLYVWKRSSLLSLGLGTVLYMVLVQVVF